MSAYTVLDAPSAPAQARWTSPQPPHAPAAAGVAAGEPALHLRHLRLALPQRTLQVRDLRIEQGERVALIGPNGVGKTSLTEAVLGLRSGVTAEGTMLGRELHEWRRRPALRRDLGVQLQRVFFPGRPRIHELIALHRSLYGPGCPLAAEALGIDALRPRLYEFLSRGETQRVDLYLALAHRPRMLFLDEPYTGLDAHHAQQLSSLLVGLSGTALLMSCHTPEELQLVHRIAWLSREGIAHFDTPQALRRTLIGEYRLAVQCTSAADAARLAARLRARLPALRGFRVDAVSIEACADTSMADEARALSDEPGVLAVQVGHTGLADLLQHCARSGL